MPHARNGHMSAVRFHNSFSPTLRPCPAPFSSTVGRTMRHVLYIPTACLPPLPSTHVLLLVNPLPFISLNRASLYCFYPPNQRPPLSTLFSPSARHTVKLHTGPVMHAKSPPEPYPPPPFLRHRNVCDSSGYSPMMSSSCICRIQPRRARHFRLSSASAR